MKLKKGPKIVIIVITLILLVAAGIALFIMLKPKTTKAIAIAKNTILNPTTILSVIKLSAVGGILNAPF